MDTLRPDEASGGGLSKPCSRLLAAPAHRRARAASWTSAGWANALFASLTLTRRPLTAWRGPAVGRHYPAGVSDQAGTDLQSDCSLLLRQTIRQICRMVCVALVISALPVAPGTGLSGQLVGDQLPLAGIQVAAGLVPSEDIFQGVSGIVQVAEAGIHASLRTGPGSGGGHRLSPPRQTAISFSNPFSPMLATSLPQFSWARSGKSRAYSLIGYSGPGATGLL